jgi:[CysO sulfur-carrier protein]-S-L-cysteine hydrolase
MLIVLPPEVRRRLKGWLRSAGKREIGGVIMAEQLEPGRFVVRDLSLDDASGSVTHFVRSPEQHAAVLEEFFRASGGNYAQFNYLGEWHSHPSFPTEPSPQDVRAMQDLVGRESNISFAVLLIVRLRFHFVLEVGGYVFGRCQAALRARVE